MTKKEIFNQRLMLLRGGRSMKAFAEDAGIIPQTMRNFFRADTEPRLSDLIRIAESNKTTVGWMLGEDVALPPGAVTSTGDSNITIGGSMTGSTANSSNQDNIGGFSELQRKLIAMDAKYGSNSTRQNYINKLEELRRIIEDEDR